MSCIEYKVVRLNVEHDNIIHLEGQLSTRNLGRCTPFLDGKNTYKGGKKIEILRVKRAKFFIPPLIFFKGNLINFRVKKKG